MMSSDRAYTLKLYLYLLAKVSTCLILLSNLGNRFVTNVFAH